MATYSIGELASRAERRATRTHAPVRRGSREKGTFETAWYRAPQRDQYGLMCDGVRLVDEHIKKERHGAPAGPLGLAGDKIMRAFHEAIDRVSGRLDVSYDWLIAKTGYSRPTIAKALRALVEYGFLEIARRCVRREVAEGEAGPRWRQATNAYRMKLPALARRLLGLKGQGAPTPDDERDRRAGHQATADAMLDALPTDEIGDAVTTDKALAAIINRMGRHFVVQSAECELTSLPQSLPFKLIEGRKDEESAPRADKSSWKR
jgi:hypothetical protein